MSQVGAASLLPAKYQWLLAEPGPKMLVEALRHYGVKERVGGADNPEILAWADELGLDSYIHDSIAWCGLLMALCAERAGKVAPEAPLWARNWLSFGEPTASPALGDVLVFQRPGGGGHVGLYVGESPLYFFVLGGNTSDMVRIAPMERSRLLQARRPLYHTQPSNVRAVALAETGEAISRNEA